MKSRLFLPLLTPPRRYFRHCLLHKIYNHNLLHSLLIPPPFYHSSHVDHMHKVGIPHCQTNTFFHSFLPTTSNYWNRLSADLASITVHALFWRSLYAYLIQMARHNSFFLVLAQLSFYLHLSLYFIRFIRRTPLCANASLCDVPYVPPSISFSLFDVHIFCFTPLWCAHIWCY